MCNVPRFVERRTLVFNESAQREREKEREREREKERGGGGRMSGSTIGNCTCYTWIIHIHGGREPPVSWLGVCTYIHITYCIVPAASGQFNLTQQL